MKYISLYHLTTKRDTKKCKANCKKQTFMILKTVLKCNRLKLF